MSLIDLYFTETNSAQQCSKTRWSSLKELIWTDLHCTKLFGTELYCTELYSTEFHCTKLYWTELYCNELYCTELYRTELWCTELYCTALDCMMLDLKSVCPWTALIHFWVSTWPAGTSGVTEKRKESTQEKVQATANQRNTKVKYKLDLLDKLKDLLVVPKV